MHASLEQLLKVQAVDSEIRFLQEAMRVRPQELDVDRRKVSQARAALDEAVRAIRDRKVEVDRGEMEIKGCDADIQKQNVALNTAKTNEEYSILKAQIEKLKEKRGELEEKVLERLGELDEMVERRKELERRVAEEERSFARKEADLGRLLQELEGKLAGLAAKREELARSVHPEHLALYDRVLDRYGDSAISVVRDSICQGCFMTVTPHYLSKLMMGNDIVQCMSCGRLLYIE